ncbi:Scd6-like Sm domain-containing protein [Mycena epipterygia]|nr:Scd6-like Sm domain-containing protein [Mycena epipterygia]
MALSFIRNHYLLFLIQIYATATALSFIGITTLRKPLSLISHSDVHYRGILAGIDPVASTIRLTNVFSMGTESHCTSPPLQEPYQYIIFRTFQVKDLSVDTAPAPHCSVYDDPAVLGTSTQAPALAAPSAPPSYAQQTAAQLPPCPQLQAAQQQQHSTSDIEDEPAPPKASSHGSVHLCSPASTIEINIPHTCPSMSDVSLLRMKQTSPQSARSYLKAENLLKIKSKLTKKTHANMHQLLRTATEDETKGMGNNDSTQLMQEMGFEYDPNTAKSSISFDPPDPKDVSITFK